ncbi:hypothetical protein CYMTET_17871 [Cymbomonas tetramitiformis]|uniref:Uncharacterized protein n=1 Tax=Cymbomonas tetramitiformis TaxID=36881 RepID=A0AAE0L6H5_9CHLO|nr:hypothetical protein CYMTET_17871 [Cymbomonas tetramitiformis]
MPSSTLIGRFGFRVGVQKTCPDPVKKTPTITVTQLFELHPYDPVAESALRLVGGTLKLVRKDENIIRRYIYNNKQRSLRPPSLSLRSPRTPTFDRWFEEDSWELQEVDDAQEEVPFLSSSQYAWHPLERQMVLKKAKEPHYNRPATVRYFQRDPLFADTVLATLLTCAHISSIG